MNPISDQQKALALLKKYRAGKCTAKESALVERWYQAFGEADLDERNHDALVEATKNILAQTAPSVRSLSARTRILRIGLSAAACLLGAFLFIQFFWRQPAGQLQEVQRYVTSKGQRKEIQLPDGSVVTLNVASSLTLENFNKNNRKVSLTGEAFFHIAKDARHPFIIHTGKIQTHVIGTSFDIFAYADEPVIRVAVASGKVQVEDAQNPHQVLGSGMTVNHLFSYNKTDSSHTLGVTDVSASTGWMSHQLQFNKATVAEIARALERTFNLRVNVAGMPSQTAHYTVKLDTENLDQLLAQLSALTRSQCRRTKTQIMIDFNNNIP